MGLQPQKVGELVSLVGIKIQEQLYLIVTTENSKIILRFVSS